MMPTSTFRSTVSQPSKARTRLDEGDEALARPLGHPITINEVHAALLGTVGLLVGYSVPVLGPLLPLYAILGRPRFHSLPHDHVEYPRSIGLRTVRHEPWWALASYVPLYFVGAFV
ncbi:hypothetical protein Halru_0842 [Halovivax ruber XH-70]|uniref:Uncharacterized protein n=1 Tax=Halovivax ruber (strain DSM 18193 / JCM 13892 / XH-70) TaxID=797302 RepID=L0IB53_HALRX|nr:hypothetical protein Halru_0842 [Halovivax ruber XH-70]